MRKTMTIEEALTHGQIVERIQYPVMDANEGDDIKAVIIETPDGEYVNHDGYVSGAYVMVLDVDTTCGRARETVEEGTIVGIVSRKAPRKQTDIGLTYAILYTYAVRALTAYVTNPNVVHIAICNYMMDTMGLRRGEIMAAFKAMNRKHEKEINAYMKGRERAYSRSASHSFPRSRKTRSNRIGFLDYLKAAMGAMNPNSYVEDAAEPLGLVSDDVISNEDLAAMGLA